MSPTRRTATISIVGHDINHLFDEDRSAQGRSRIAALVVIAWILVGVALWSHFSDSRTAAHDPAPQLAHVAPAPPLDAPPSSCR